MTTIGDLLARIHRDGGHYEAAHGLDTALAHAEQKIIAMRAALELAVLAMRHPLDEWKGDVERKALDVARVALLEASGWENHE